MSTSDSCLCSLESTSDFVLVYSPQDDTGTSVHETTAAASKSTVFQNIRQAFVNVANVVLRKGECCAQGGWVDYPQDDDDHSIDAHNIFQCLREEIQENRQRLLPPVTMLCLQGYKYQPLCSNEQFSCYYYLQINAGQDFYLYVKAGLTNEEFGHIKLLRLSSVEEKVINTCN